MRVMTVIGARPQFVKAAALSREMSRRRADGVDVEDVIVHTGQHYDAGLSSVFFDELGITPPQIMLEVGSGLHGEQTGETMRRLEPHVVELEPDAIVVYGDTNSTVAAALVAAKLRVPLVHVEAGLRSFNRDMPEEINRVVADHVSNLLLCPSEQARSHLASEGIVDGVHVVGDVMLDVLLHELDKLDADNTRFSDLGLSDRPKVLVTLHRPSNVDDPIRLQCLLSAIGELAGNGIQVIWPAHPRLAARLDASPVPGIHLIEPLKYSDMLKALRDVDAVVTDSGGLQKEAFWMQRRCFTLRNETEWVETVASGWNTLLGERPHDLVLEVEAALGETLPSPPELYGDGAASARCVDLILQRAW